MSKPKALDLFCGAGGASMGLHRAGFDVTGVDIKPQPRYPFTFVQSDAIEYPLDGFDFIWASPPCQAYSRMSRCRPGESWPDLVGLVRERVIDGRTPYVIENVIGAPLITPLVLCGTMFGLRSNGKELRRHRAFECRGFNWPLIAPCVHRLPALAVYGHSGGTPTKGRTPRSLLWERREGMETHWMNRDEIAEAIPPAFSEFIGRQALAFLT